MENSGWNSFQNDEGYSVNSATVEEQNIWENLKTAGKIGGVLASVLVSLYGANFLYEKLYKPFKEAYNKTKVNTGPSKAQERVMNGRIFNYNETDAFRAQMKTSKTEAEDADFEILN